MGKNTADSTRAMPTRGSGDLLHGDDGGFLGVETAFLHEPFDVFHHHDGVVDQQADGQDHGQHGQGVDGVAAGRHDGEGAEQDHRHGDGWNERGPEVL